MLFRVRGSGACQPKLASNGHGKQAQGLAGFRHVPGQGRCAMTLGPVLRAGSQHGPSLAPALPAPGGPIEGHRRRKQPRTRIPGKAGQACVKAISEPVSGTPIRDWRVPERPPGASPRGGCPCSVPQRSAGRTARPVPRPSVEPVRWRVRGIGFPCLMYRSGRPPKC